MRKYRWDRLGIALLASVIAATLAVACGGGEEASPSPRPAATSAPQPSPTRAAPQTPTGTLRISLPSFGFEEIEPSMGRSDDVLSLGTPLFDWLTWHYADGSLAPGIATKWELSSDGTTWTYTIRTDLRFHSGQPLTAEDVRFSIERVIRPDAKSSFGSVWKSSVGSIDAVSPSLVRVTTKKAWPLMPFAASPREGGEGAAVSKGYFDAVGSIEFARKPVGTGPWSLAEHTTGQKFVFAAVTGHPYRGTPGFSRLEMSLVPEESTRLAQLKTGAIEITPISPDSVTDMQNSRMQVLRIENAASGMLTFFGWGEQRLTSNPLSNREVRQALTLAVNRPELITTILGGLGTLPTYSPFNIPGVLGYNSAWRSDPYDPDRARTILSNAGLRSGQLTVPVYSYSHPAAPWLPRAAEAVSGYWDRVGVKTRIIPIDRGVLTQKYRERPQPDDLIGTYMVQAVPTSPTATNYYGGHYGTKAVVLAMPASENDKLVADITTVPDENQRVQLVRQLIERVYAEYVHIPLALTPTLFAARPEIGGWEPVNSAAIGMALEKLRRK